MMITSILYWTTTLSCIFIVLPHWNNSLQIDMSPNSDILSWFRANQSLLFLLSALCLVEKQQPTNFIVFGLKGSGFEPTIKLKTNECCVIEILYGDQFLK